ncbi:cytochrome P450 [Hymenobacter lucidus]|uniref:Cytochrome P450 n=1 Tax=Hymenobacter lucidus TaxID=2880930 RepID=A0ABS8AX95_9BACT|nr:cytochrome P450 [Hymenobacter lucidus]MCB2410412.1 cytochrome P450 [Hymenobacter lucidus]
MLRFQALPRALVARYAPPIVKQLMRRTWHRLRQLGRKSPAQRLLFTFNGRHPYAPGTGRDLYAHEPAFRTTVQECERVLTQVLGGPSIISNFTGPPAAPDFFADEARLLLTNVVMQLALVELWLAHGVQPEGVLGVSVGEAAAVYAAGGLSLPDALRVGLNCCVVSQVSRPDYTLLVVNAGFATVGRLTDACPVELLVVLLVDAGCCLALCPKVDVAAAQQYLAAHGISSTAPPTSLIWPYHSPHLAQHLEALRAPLQDVCPQPLALPCYLGTAGRQLPVGTVLGPEYWLSLVQYPLDIHGTLGAALADGYQLFLPIGVDSFPFLRDPAQRASLAGVQVLPGLQPPQPELTTIGANRKLLADYGLVKKHPLPRPAFGAATFITQFSLGALETSADPYSAYAHLLRQGGLHFLPANNSWLVLDTALINAVLREPLVFSSSPNAGFESALIGADPPVHTANRQLLQPFFAPKQLAGLREFTEAMVAELSTTLQAQPSFDFVNDFTIPLTQAVSAQLLGLTADERQSLQRCLPGHAYQLDYLEALTSFFDEYLQRQQPTAAPTILNHLLTLTQAGQLAQDTAISLIKTMWLASIVTSSMLMSNAAYYLLTHPTVADQLRDNPSLVEPFIEEILRLEPSLSAIARVTTQAVTLGDQELPAGAFVVCSIVAANRDPAYYSKPDEVDLSRRPARHLSFGGGIHACLGAHLARLEARTVLHWLIAQGPGFRQVNPSAPAEYFPSHTFRALNTLPVSWPSTPDDSLPLSGT